MGFALGLAVVSISMSVRSTTLLKQARADFERGTAEAALDGAHFEAVAQVIRSGAGGPYRWSLTTDNGWTEVIAESEREKVDLNTAAEIADQTFIAMDVADIGALRTRLSAAANDDLADVGALDDGALWKSCAAHVMSSLGAAPSLNGKVFQAVGKSETPAWRIGEVWRFRVTTSAGWRDDRIVRFTGDARKPSAIISRRLSRTHGGQGECDAVLTALG